MSKGRNGLNGSNGTTQAHFQEAGWDPDILEFVDEGADRPNDTMPAVSLFSNAGIGDYGYYLAGFDFLVHAELEEKRCELLAENYPDAEVVCGDLRETVPHVVDAYAQTGEDPPALLAASPPCQGMTTANQRSDSNAWRHEVREDDRNYLYDTVADVAASLEPRVVVVENVPDILVTGVRDPETGEARTVAQALLDRMPDYREVTVRLQLADYGVPQRRERVFLVFAREDEPWFDRVLGENRLPLPGRTHGPHRKPRTTLRHALSEERYTPLDGEDEEAATDDEDPLHFVPTYNALRYSWISRNPPYEGMSSFDNLYCEYCEEDKEPPVTAKCPDCRRVMKGVPRIWENENTVRPIRGRKTAYKRMDPDRPAPTITTASGRLGSDTTLHPWQHRVLSIRECADLQTIPREFDLVRDGEVEVTLARQVVGEAIPPWFTYETGRVLRGLLRGEGIPPGQLLSPSPDVTVRVDEPSVTPFTGFRASNPVCVPSLNGGEGQTRADRDGSDAREPDAPAPETD